MKTPRPLWEYVTLPLLPHSDDPDDTLLNEAGQHAWELVAVVGSLAYFKRPYRWEPR